MAADGRRRKDVRTWPVPALSPRSGGPAERFAGRLAGLRPAGVFLAALLTGFTVLAGVSLLLGLLVTDVLLHFGGLGRTDQRVVESIVADRTPFLTDASAVASAAGGAPVLPILVGLVGLACAVLHRWWVAAYAVLVLLMESATYRVTSLLVPRQRPSVHRLEDLPADASYPSGHTAASIAVYAGLALLLTSAIRNRRLRVVAWAAAVILPIVVATSRMYRGMHHPLDVAGGVLVGIGAVIVLLFACRSAEAAVRAPARTPRRVARHGRMRAAS